MGQRNSSELAMGHLQSQPGSAVGSAASFRGYDLIGDVHGCANTLSKLLEVLGYRQVNGIYQHRQRQAIFIGDIVDRGPRVREALHLVRDMVDRGSARIVMGNHEYNALCYCTRSRPGSQHEYLREHSPRHNRLIADTLEQFANYGHEWNEFLEWFYTLPIFLELDGFRAVHACWDDQLIEQFKTQYQSNLIDEDFLHASVASGSFAFKVMDRLLRGTDMRLPDNRHMVGRDGLTRHFFRTLFWADQPRTYGDIVFQPDPLPDDIASRPFTDAEQARLLRYPVSEPPVFFGHYWMQGTPKPIKPNLACLDYSAVKYGKLVAYRMDGETKLDARKFVWVDVPPPELPEPDDYDDDYVEYESPSDYR
ncbi:metallophosphoesterase [Hydrocarboniclastica marina]|nr:metallophosphoesterase [Hydrocarboniclastica marina]